MITNISFKARKPYYGMGTQNNRRDRQNGVTSPLFKDEQHKARFSPEIKTQPTQDEFVPQIKEQYKEFDGVEDVEVVDFVDDNAPKTTEEKPFEEYKMYEGRNFSKPLAVILAASTMAYTGAGIVYVSNNMPVDEPETVIVENVKYAEDLMLAASKHDTDINVLMAYNGINDIYQLHQSKESREIKIPNKYDAISPKLATLEEALADGGNNDYQTARLQIQIADLKAKKERQDELAFAYKDGEYVHFYMKDYTLATELEKAFDIKHGKLERVESGESVYKYYDDPALSQNQIYRVKLQDIKK